MKKQIAMIFLILVLLLLVACDKKSEEDEVAVTVESVAETKETEAETIAETEEPEEVIPKGYVKSRLTGEYVPEEVAEKRPFALMFNNIKVASPQSGTSEASILYEALVEGNITRLMGIFEEFKSDRIGSVRSGRQYFISIADEYDSIFVSFGESAYGSEKISELNINQVSGMRAEGSTVFYRDNSLKAPHNAFASAQGIQKGTEMKGYNTDYDEDLNNHFTFYSEDTDLTSDQIVNKLTLAFSNYASPYFEYDKLDKAYKRFQYDTSHIDANTGEQLVFKNIIIQFVEGFSIDETRNFSFRQGSGNGFYITNGKANPITWDKNESNRSMVYYDKNGDMLQINPGKTYIAVFPSSRESNVTFE